MAKPAKNPFLARFQGLWTPMWLPVLIAAFGAIAMVTDSQALRGMRNTMFDQYQRWQPRVYVDVPVRIIDVDEESLKRLGQWPWPRTWIADMIQILRHAQAAVIGFDVVFSEPDRTSPDMMAKVWLDDASKTGGTTNSTNTNTDPKTDADSLRSMLNTLRNHDEVMRDAVKGGGVVLGFTLGPQQMGNSSEPGTLAKFAPYVQKGAHTLDSFYRFDQLVSSLLPFQQAAAGNGALTFVPDDDGVVRRVPLVLRYKDQPVPSFAAEMLRVAQNATTTVLTSAEALGGKSAGLEEVRIGTLAIPTNAEGEAWVHYTGTHQKRYIPAWKVLANQVPPDELKGKLLLIGSSAQGLMDLRFSALGRIIPGVEVHAQALEQMLSNKPLTRPTWAISIELLLMLVVSLTVGVLALKAQSLWGAGLTLLTVGSVFSVGWLAFSEFEVLIDPLTPSLIVIASWMLCSLVHHFLSERQQRWLTDAFSRYVSPNKVAYLVSHPEGLELGGTRQTCSFIFTDLQGFTTMMERMDPTEAVTSLNAYLDGMVAIAFKHEGTLDRIMGDAVAVVFSAPVMQADHRQRAYICALEMHAFAKRYAADLQAKGVRFGNTRIGVHSGDVIVGNFGGTHMFDYRALGDPVNTAARLESVNKHLGTLFCMSEAVYVGCADTVVRPVGRLVLKGKTKALMVYEPVVDGDEQHRAPLSEYRYAYDLLAAQRLNGLDPAESTEAFTALYARYPQDPLVRLHLARLQKGETGDEIVMLDK